MNCNKKIEHTIVEFSLARATIGPDASVSNTPYISIFPPKLCNIHLIYIRITKENEQHKQVIFFKSNLEGKVDVTTHKGCRRIERMIPKRV